MAAVNFSPLLNFQDAECSICQNTAEDANWVFHEEATSQQDQKVQHTFHKSCVKEWLKRPEDPRSCPLCRKQVNVMSLLEENEVDTYFKEENSILKEWVERKNQRNKLLTMVAIVCTFGCLLIEDRIGQEIGIDIKGGSTVLINGLVAAAFTAIQSRSELAIAREAFCVNAAYSASLYAFLNVIDPFYLNPNTKNSPGYVLYGVATAVLNYYYLPSKIEFISGNQNERPHYRIYTWPGPILMMVACLFARNAWK